MIYIYCPMLGIYTINLLYLKQGEFRRSVADQVPILPDHGISYLARDTQNFFFN